MEELNSALPPTANQRDPFSAIAGTVPPLPVLQRPVPPPSTAPDTSVAVGVAVQGVMQIGAETFAFVLVPGKKSALCESW